jgi:hypothetical protein
MSLHCADGGYDGDGENWWECNLNLYPLATRRRRKCCSCGNPIQIGEECGHVNRARGPQNDIEERIYGDEVPMAKWYLCETCTDLAVSLDELGFCFSLGGDSIAAQIKEYRQQELEHAERMKRLQP